MLDGGDDVDWGDDDGDDNGDHDFDDDDDVVDGRTVDTDILWDEVKWVDFSIVTYYL